jgi:hypothetical protein
MAYPNTHHTGNWKISFSNIPVLKDTKVIQKYMEGYVKSLIIPDYNMEESFSPFMGEQIRHQISRQNENLSQLQIDFKLAEDGLNYFYLLEWIVKMRNPQLVGVHGNEALPEAVLRENACHRLTLHFLNNQKITVAYVHFTEAWPLNVSSISLDMGTDEEVIFTTNFSYESVTFETVSL